AERTNHTTDPTRRGNGFQSRRLVVLWKKTRMLGDPLAVTRSILPSPLRSPAWTVAGPGRPALIMLEGAWKVPSPLARSEGAAAQKANKVSFLRSMQSAAKAPRSAFRVTPPPTLLPKYKGDKPRGRCILE